MIRTWPILAVFAVGCTSTALEPAVFIEKTGMQPVNPIPYYQDLPATTPNAEILNALPNETVRMAVSELEHKSGATWGPVGITAEGKSYSVALDYIKYKIVTAPAIECPDHQSKAAPEGDGTSAKPKEPPKHTCTFHDNKLRVSGTVAIGLRIKADFTSLKAGLNLTNLYGLGLAAQTGGITGTLSVQSLGITGKSITPLIPMPSEISVSSIQNAIQSAATMKAMIYEERTGAKDVSITPELVSVAFEGGEMPLGMAVELLLRSPTSFQAAANIKGVPEKKPSGADGKKVEDAKPK